MKVSDAAKRAGVSGSTIRRMVLTAQRDDQGNRDIDPSEVPVEHRKDPCDHVTTTEAAKLLRCSPRKVCTFFDEGRIGGFRINKDRRISLWSLRRYMYVAGIPWPGKLRQSATLITVNAEPKDIQDLPCQLVEVIYPNITTDIVSLLAFVIGRERPWAVCWRMIGWPCLTHIRKFEDAMQLVEGDDFHLFVYGPIAKETTYKTLAPREVCEIWQ